MSPPHPCGARRAHQFPIEDDILITTRDPDNLSAALDPPQLPTERSADSGRQTDSGGFLRAATTVVRRDAARHQRQRDVVKRRHVVDEAELLETNEIEARTLASCPAGRAAKDWERAPLACRRRTKPSPASSLSA